MQGSSTKISDTVSHYAGLKDQHFMEQALSLALRGQGMTGSNPTVGCVIVSADGAVVGIGQRRVPVPAPAAATKPAVPPPTTTKLYLPRGMGLTQSSGFTLESQDRFHSS